MRFINKWKTREGFTEKIALEQRPKEGEGVSHAGNQGQTHWAEKIASAKTPGKSAPGFFQQRDQ